MSNGVQGAGGLTFARTISGGIDLVAIHLLTYLGLLYLPSHERDGCELLLRVEDAAKIQQPGRVPRGPPVFWRSQPEDLPSQVHVSRAPGVDYLVLACGPHQTAMLKAVGRTLFCCFL